MEDQLSIKLAKIAKKKGFYVDTNGFFYSIIRNHLRSSGGTYVWMSKAHYNFPKDYFENDDLLIRATTLHKIQEWLRETHNISVDIITGYGKISGRSYGFMYNCKISTIKNNAFTSIYIQGKSTHIGYGWVAPKIFQSHQDALEEGLCVALEQI